MQGYQIGSGSDEPSNSSRRSMQPSLQLQQLAAPPTGIPSALAFSLPTLASAPPGRWSHACASIAGASMLAHGGIGPTGALLDDCWLVDGNTLSWRHVAAVASKSPKDKPEKCLGHAAVEADGVVWFFGGQQGRKLLGKLYSLNIDLQCWTRHNVSQLPPPRAGHSMVAVHGGREIYVFGGQGKKLLNDVWMFKPQDAAAGFTEVSCRGSIPLPRHGHSLVSSGDDSLIMFGGTSTVGIDNALHILSLSSTTWSRVTAAGKAPSPRTQHSAVMVSPQAMLVFGGCNAQGVFFNDFHVLDVTTLTWSQPHLLTAPPAPRYHHSCCMINGRCVLYGGINSRQTFEGLVVVETRFDIDSMASIAAELSVMASAASSHGLPAPPQLLQAPMQASSADSSLKGARGLWPGFGLFASKQPLPAGSNKDVLQRTALQLAHQPPAAFYSHSDQLISSSLDQGNVSGSSSSMVTSSSPLQVRLPHPEGVQDGPGRALTQVQHPLLFTCSMASSKTSHSSLSTSGRAGAPSLSDAASLYAPGSGQCSGGASAARSTTHISREGSGHSSSRPGGTGSQASGGLQQMTSSPAGDLGQASPSHCPTAGPSGTNTAPSVVVGHPSLSAAPPELDTLPSLDTMSSQAPSCHAVQQPAQPQHRDQPQQHPQQPPRGRLLALHQQEQDEGPPSQHMVSEPPVSQSGQQPGPTRGPCDGPQHTAQPQEPRNTSPEPQAAPSAPKAALESATGRQQGRQAVPASAAPPAAASGHNPAASLPSQGPAVLAPDLQLMQLQLTELLMRRNAEQVQQQTLRKVQELESVLEQERAAKLALSKECSALQLLVQEAEQERAQWETRSKECSARLVKEAAAAADANAQVVTLTAKLSAVAQDLTSARSLQQGLVKELSLISSRYTKLYQHYERSQRRRSTQAPRSGTQQGPPASPAPRGSSPTHSLPLDPHSLPSPAHPAANHTFNSSSSSSSNVLLPITHTTPPATMALRPRSSLQPRSSRPLPISPLVVPSTQVPGQSAPLQPLHGHADSGMDLSGTRPDLDPPNPPFLYPTSPQGSRLSTESGHAYAGNSGTALAMQQLVCLSYPHTLSSSPDVESDSEAGVVSLLTTEVRSSHTLSGGPSSGVRSSNSSTSAATRAGLQQPGSSSNVPAPTLLLEQANRASSPAAPGYNPLRAAGSAAWGPRGARAADCDPCQPSVAAAAAAAAVPAVWGEGHRSSTPCDSSLRLCEDERLQRSQSGSCEQLLGEEAQQPGARRAQSGRRSRGLLPGLARSRESQQPAQSPVGGLAKDRAVSRRDSSAWPPQPSSGGEATVGSSHSGPLPPSETNACGQLLLLLSGAEAARAALVEQLTELQGSHEALHQEMEALGSQLQLLRGNPQALAALAMSDLQSLEAELEHTCRCVRATLLQRSTDEAALRASHEKATCALCLEEVKAMVFNCGHQSCSACAAKLQACPFCRVKITAKIKLFA